MAQLTDPWGLDLSVPEDPNEADRALQRCVDLIEAYVTFAPDAADKLMSALSPPAAPLSLITAACLLVQVHTHTDRERAAGIVTQLTAPGAIELNQREAAHLEALRFLVAGQNDRAADAWIAIVDQWPTDLLATRLGHFVCFNRGRLADMMRLADRSIAAWDDLPFRSYLDGMRAFTLEEQGQYREAERLARGAVEADHTDLWSVHAVAHVLEMEARTDDGLAWFEGRDDDLVGSFARHLWWHHAIIHLRTGDYERLLDLYDREIQPGDATDALSLTIIFLTLMLVLTFALIAPFARTGNAITSAFALLSQVDTAPLCGGFAQEQRRAAWCIDLVAMVHLGNFDIPIFAQTARCFADQKAEHIDAKRGVSRLQHGDFLRSAVDQEMMAFFEACGADDYWLTRGNTGIECGFERIG